MKTIEELNAAVSEHRRNNELSATEREVLDVLSRHSCKDVGRSWLAKSTIAELVGKSRRTVIRACNRLESLGIIRQYKRMRQTGDKRQTSNLIVIQAPPAPSVTPACHTEETPSRNTNNTYKATAGALKRSIPAPLFKALAPYFNDDEMYRAVGILYRAKASVDRSITVEDHASEFIDGLQSVIFAYKRGRVRSLFGCLYAAWREVAVVIKRREVFADMYDWLAS